MKNFHIKETRTLQYIFDHVSYLKRNMTQNTSFLSLCLITCNLGHKTCRLFHVLAQFLFTTSETELDYYHQKVSVRDVSQAAGRPKTKDLRKLKNFENAWI